MLSESKTSVLLLNRQIMVNKGSMQTEADSRMQCLERTREMEIPRSSGSQTRRGMLLGCN